MPKEKVFIHTNNTLLLTGEKLLYKFYSLESETNKLSDFSKVGWVQLINNKKEVVFQHKVKLKKGQGFADFFIPANLNSGAYKLVAYTNWMLNAQANYFQQEIYILNPYQESNEDLEIEEKNQFTRHKTNFDNQEISLILNKNTFQQREEVVLEIENPNQLSGNFSISVRRIDSINKPPRVTSLDFNKLFENIKWSFNDTLFYPEIRGTFFQGKIEADPNPTSLEKNISISSPGEKNQLQIVSTDAGGKFSFILNEVPNEDEFIMQVLNDEVTYKINLQEQPKLDYSKLSFSTPGLATSNKEYILEKSINIQIENAYNATKSDRFVNLDNNYYFFDEELITYNLDDYNRFPDLSQTFTEVIKFGRIRRNDEGENIFLVRNKNPLVEFDSAALLLIDGVILNDHEKLISYDPQQIKSIGILRNKLFLGPSAFEGAIIVNTKSGDFPNEFQDESMISTKLKIPRKSKEYYSPNYPNESLRRIPDYRYQLLWNPEVKFNDEPLRLFTSDLNGEFEINLEGFTEDGKPISITKTFYVE
ncbi:MULTISPECIES: hypothetical protein [Salegentibacter]|nr:MULTISPECIES: hypothetical protein [Salegentibacter]